MEQYQVLDITRDKLTREILSIIVTGVLIGEMEVGVDIAIEEIENKDCEYFIFHNRQVYPLLVKEKNGYKYLTTQKNEKEENYLETLFWKSSNL